MAFVPFEKTDQPTMANFNEKFQQAIADAVNQADGKAVKIKTGSYVGTGSLTNTIYPGISPKFFAINPNEFGGGGYIVYGGSGSILVGSNTFSKGTYISGSTVHFEISSGSTSYVNESGYTYSWVAIG